MLAVGRLWLGVARFADLIDLRENTVIDRAGLPDQPGPFEVGFRDKPYNFAHILAPKL